MKHCPRPSVLSKSVMSVREWSERKAGRGLRRPRLLRMVWAALFFVLAGGCASNQERARPNFVIIFTDDQGYNDVGAFGSTLIRTPRLDQMAKEGTRFTSFYAQTVCGPSRTALLTGSYPVRGAEGFGWNLPGPEITVAEVLKEVGYSTYCVGKWDLSGRKYIEDRHPLSQGFDAFFGTLGANDSGKVQLMQDREFLEIEEDMGRLTGLYTEKAVSFLRNHKQGPFFLYLAHTMPHTIIGASESFLGKSPRGLYGDVIEEIDWSVGQILDTLRATGLDENTIVVFTSDNGPWLIKQANGGSAFPLRGGKGSAWEGGFRVPAILWGPGWIPEGRVANDMMATLDILPTFAALAGAQVPTDRVIDGRDQSGYVTGQDEVSNRTDFYYFVNPRLEAVRQGRWKLQLPREEPIYRFAAEDAPIAQPQLFDLEADLSEQTNLAGSHPEIVNNLLDLARAVREDLGDEEIPGQGWRRY